MCRHSETQHNILEPIQPVTSSQDPPFAYVNLAPDNDKSIFYCGDIIRFSLPETGILFPESLQLFFNLRTDFVSNNGRGWTFNSDIRTIFQYCRILHGRTVVIDDIQEFGQLAFINEIYNNESALIPLTNYGYLTGQQVENNVANLTSSATDRTGYHNTSNTASTVLTPGHVPRRYMVNLNVGFLHSKQKPLPLKFLKNRLVIEFKLQDSPYTTGYFIGASLAGLNPLRGRDAIHLGRVNLQFKVEYGNYVLEKAIETAIRSSQLQYQWDGWYHQKAPLNNQQLFQRITVNCFQKRIKYALACLRSEADAIELDNDATSMYCALNPNAVNPSTSTSVDEARRTMLKTYQWRYNQRAFPDYPIQVAGTRAVETGTTTSTNLEYPVNVNYTSSGAEAWYYLNETLHPGKAMVGPFTQDFPFLTIDAVNSTLPITTKQQGAMTNVGTRTYPCAFVIAGKFFYTSIDGATTYAIDGKSLNSKLELFLEFNNLPSAPADAPAMFLDIWVAFDNVLTLEENGMYLLDN